ncbi:glycosyltransferase family 9 protein [Roseibium aggregatum]|uniref:glycosyltransferase family 9 protein n=1 Tax=Roseibium aggregatum TaxID=187304 RepID=UPI0025AD79D6|nr:glycosyltransferase family 9 protein [Roseibium aggregatum]WJS05556.1 glycosyltransferase family 9 protein [Roseibium aggregatum]
MLRECDDIAEASSPAGLGRRVMLVNFSGLGNAICVSGLMRATKQSGLGWSYVHNVCPGLSDSAFCLHAGLDMLHGLYPGIWRRFSPDDWPEIEQYLEANEIDTIINLRNEGPDFDVGYAAFKSKHVERFAFFDLFDDAVAGRLGTRNLMADWRELFLRAGARIKAPHAWLTGLLTTEVAAAGNIGFFPTSSQMVKRWKDDNWIRLTQLLQARGQRRFRIVSGILDQEREDALRLAENLHRRLAVEVHVAFYDDTLGFLRGLEGLEVLVANDTAAVHAGAALGIPTVGIYLATSGLIWGGFSSEFVAVQSADGLACPEQKPHAGNCRLYYSGCPAPCHDSVTPERVARTVEELRPISTIS